MGPLTGIKIIEIAGLGAGPFCGMMLADMGAEVIRIEKPGGHPAAPLDPLARNRRSLACDLKHPDSAGSHHCACSISLMHCSRVFVPVWRSDWASVPTIA